MKKNQKENEYHLIFSKNSRTDSALDMLSMIMQKVTKQIVNAPSVSPDFYDQMTGISIALADAINQIENGADSITYYNNYNNGTDDVEFDFGIIQGDIDTDDEDDISDIYP